MDTDKNLHTPDDFLVNGVTVVVWTTCVPAVEAMPVEFEIGAECALQWSSFSSQSSNNCPNLSQTVERNITKNSSL
ncbi:hypothetical protein SDJN02_09182, partial [Cucurbita argyrosperma subsp. argyrosperma]